MKLMRKKDYYDPFSELERLQDEMTKLFDISFGRNPHDETQLLSRTWSPAVDVFDGEDTITIKADLPGLNKDDIKVSIENDVLIIQGEKKHEEETKEKGFLRRERFYGGFYRAIALPQAVDTTKIKAGYKNGTLELTVPKKEEAKPKQISIEVK